MMRVSVLIPAYNCSATIEATLDSVLRQTSSAHEILVMDDGSTDQTPEILKAYGSQINVFRRENRGLAAARNELIKKASGDLIAFLDSDDIWHAKYLEVQQQVVLKYPNAVGFFTGHVDFAGEGGHEWDVQIVDIPSSRLEVMQPLDFLKRYVNAPGSFLMSFCCVPKQLFGRIATDPFKLRIAEDVYFCNLMLLFGPIVFCSIPLVAYRVREKSLSSNRLKLNFGEVNSFELLNDHFRASADRKIFRAYEQAFAVKRRLYAKTLMGAGRVDEARKQLRKAFNICKEPKSLGKSVGLLVSTYAPRCLQPKWPPSVRQWGDQAQHR
jgi:glycosyltransferase involved in cell wall biosynthesis